MSAEQQFWKWFKAHEDELFHFERDQEPTFDRLADALGEVDDDLTFEFGPKRDGRREFVISAAGLKRAFPSVARLYDARPQLDRFPTPPSDHPSTITFFAPAARVKSSSVT